MDSMIHAWRGVSGEILVSVIEGDLVCENILFVPAFYAYNVKVAEEYVKTHYPENRYRYFVAVRQLIEEGKSEIMMKSESRLDFGLQSKWRAILAKKRGRKKAVREPKAMRKVKIRVNQVCEDCGREIERGSYMYRSDGNLPRELVTPGKHLKCAECIKYFGGIIIE